MTAQELQALIYRARQYVNYNDQERYEAVPRQAADLINDLAVELERSEQSIREAMSAAYVRGLEAAMQCFVDAVNHRRAQNFVSVDEASRARENVEALIAMEQSTGTLSANVPRLPR